MLRCHELLTRRGIAGDLRRCAGLGNPHILQYAAVSLPRAPCIPPALPRRRGRLPWLRGPRRCAGLLLAPDVHRTSSRTLATSHTPLCCGFLAPRALHPAGSAPPSWQASVASRSAALRGASARAFFFFDKKFFSFDKGIAEIRVMFERKNGQDRILPFKHS